MSPDLPERLANSDWAEARRAEGKAIMLVGKSGRIHHVDAQIAQWLGREQLGQNAFDLVPAHMAAEGSQSMADNVHLDDYTVWFPMVDADNVPQWFRWDGRRVEGFLLNALSPELDPAEQYVHVVAS